MLRSSLISFYCFIVRRRTQREGRTGTYVRDRLEKMRRKPCQGCAAKETSYAGNLFQAVGRWQDKGPVIGRRGFDLAFPAENNHVIIRRIEKSLVIEPLWR